MRQPTSKCLVAAAMLLASPAAFGADPSLIKTQLFEGGQDGYKLYRIPGIVVTKHGTVLVYCEARKFTGGDWEQPAQGTVFNSPAGDCLFRYGWLWERPATGMARR